MAVNKVVYGTTVLVDLTADTVAPDNLLYGETAHGADGDLIEGAFVPFDPSPWRTVEVGEITPTSETTQIAADTAKGTPIGLIITRMRTNNISAANNAIVTAVWAVDSDDLVCARNLYYYKSASSRSSTTLYPTYSNGVFSLNKQLHAGWTYYYCIIYG